MPAPTQSSAVSGVNGTTTGNAALSRTLNGVAQGSSLIMLVALANSGSATDPACTVSDGTSYTAAVYKRATSNHRTVGLFYRHNVSAGNYTAALSHGLGSGVLYGDIQLIEVSGLVNAAPDTAKGQNGAEPGNGSSQSLSSGSSGTLTNASNMTFGICLAGSGASLSSLATPSGYNSLNLDAASTGASYIGCSFCWLDVSVTTAINLSFGTDANDYYWAATVLAFQKSASGILNRFRRGSLTGGMREMDGGLRGQSASRIFLPPNVSARLHCEIAQRASL